MPFTRIPPRTCPNCGKSLNASANVNDDSVPSPGDFCLCLYCDTFLVFADDLSLRLPTKEEEADAMEARDMIDTQLFTRAYRKSRPPR